MTLNKRTYTVKTVLLGDTSVGKSSISLRFTRNEYFEYQEPTIGAAFMNKEIDKETYKVKFEIWDTAGQERYNSLAPMYYRNAKISVIVYDVSNTESFKRAKKWVNELKSKLDNPYIILIGNKCDLQNKCNQNEVKEYCTHNKIKHFFCSAKNNTNVFKVFDYIAENLPKFKFNEDNSNNINSFNYEKNRSCFTTETNCC